jgi:ELWxxDGT repeat protein
MVMAHKKNLFLFLVNLIFVLGVSAQAPLLVKDINSASQPSYPAVSAVANNKLFFVRFFSETGYELWVTDLTSGSTFVKDINPGVNSSNINEIISTGNAVFFAADDGVHGSELWTSDGTLAGTKLFLDINPSGDSSPFSFTYTGSLLLFDADDGVHGHELWRSDLTPGGTVLYADILPGPVGSLPTHIRYFAHLVFQPSVDGIFMAADTTLGRELVRIPFNGGVPVVFDLNPSGGSNVYGLRTVSSGVSSLRMYFNASDGVHGQELWTSDGSLAGTYMVKDLNPGIFDTDFGPFTPAVGNVTFARSFALIDDEPCVSTGAANNLTCFDLTPGIESSTPRDFTATSSFTYFSASTPNSGRELWKTNGATVSQVAELAPGALSALSGDFVYGGSSLMQFKGTLYFAADDRVSGTELWSTNGTSTALFKDLHSGPAGSDPTLLAQNSTHLIFAAQDANTRAIWKSDGSSSGTVPVFDLSDGTTASSFPASFFSIGTKLFFNATTNPFGSDLWTSDGTGPGTHLFKELEVGSFTKGINAIRPLGSTGLFAFNGNDGAFVWHSDGTEAGTVAFSQPEKIVDGVKAYAVLGGITYFAGQTTTHGSELWRSDGTPPGTFLVKDIRPGTPNSNPQGFVLLNNTMLFSANDGANGSELWISDGTTNGTKLLKDIYPGVNGSTPSELFEFNGKVLFRADFSGIGSELGVTDGTPAGTMLLKDIAAGAAPSVPNSFTQLGANVFFGALEGGSNYSLMRTDGTASGTVAIAAGVLNGFSVQPFIPFATVGSHLIFSAKDQGHGTELWSSDGTSAGTSLLKDMYVGTISSNPGQFTEIEGFVYFGARDSTHGTELWRTDGTVNGTVLVADIALGQTSSSPQSLFPFRGTLYFNARTDALGAELWKVVLDECPDDLNKKSIGQCGCGVADLDGNKNGVLDCFGNLDLKQQVTKIQKLLSKIKEADTIKSEKALSKNKQTLKKMLKSLVSFSQMQHGFVAINSGKPLSSFVKPVNKLTLKALNVNAPAFDTNKKKAATALKKLKKAL